MKILKILLLAIVLFISNAMCETTKKDIHIAVAGPMSGEYSQNGLAILQSVQLYINDVNNNGGINGHQIIIDVYDDKNKVDLACKVALDIVKSDAIAVIGHNFSSTSIAAGKIYQKYKIPAITSTATNDMVTKNNDWYFSTISNTTTLSSFLALYAKFILHSKNVAVVFNDKSYGKALANTFLEKANKIELNIVFQKQFIVNDKNIDLKLNNISKEILKDKKIDIIFLSMQTIEGVKLIKFLKDGGYKGKFLVPDSFDSNIFIDGFDHFEENTFFKNIYTNGVIIGNPLIFDAANKKTHEFEKLYTKVFQSVPNWRAAYSYDAAIILVNILKRTNLKFNSQSDRKKIKENIYKIRSTSNAIHGITGLNYFDKHGDQNKPYSIGYFKDKVIYPAFKQIEAIYRQDELNQQDNILGDDSLLLINSNSYALTKKIVYVGIKLNEITSLNIKNMTYDADFHIWFRFQGKVDFNNITFLNSVEKIKLDDCIKEKEKGLESYKLFHVKAKFKSNIFSGRYLFGQNIININFKHNKLTSDNLLFVYDKLSMPDVKTKTEDIKNKLKILSPTSGWTIQSISMYQNSILKNVLGDIDYINKKQKYIEFSCFNLDIFIKEDVMSLRGSINKSTALFLLVLSVSFALFLILFKSNKFFHKFYFIYFFAQIITISIILISSEIYLVEIIIDIVSRYEIKTIVTVYSVVWWIFIAIYFNKIIKLIIWNYLEEKAKKSVPQIVKGFTSFLTYLLTLFMIIANVFNMEITSLLATSGMAAMIIGLALQSVLGNIFSGIALNIERPFRTGDWIKIKDYKEGKIIDISWRSTKVQLRNNSIISIPNSTVTENLINNMTYPNHLHKDFLLIEINQDYNIQRVMKILLDAVYSSNLIMKNPEPNVSFKGIEKSMGVRESLAVYAVSYTIDDYANKFSTRNDVWFRVIKHLSRAKIDFDLNHTFKKNTNLESPLLKNTNNTIEILKKIYLFHPFSKEDIEKISKKITCKYYDKSDVIFNQGDQSDSMFIIIEGTISIQIKNADKLIEVAKLGVDEILGEMGLLTGESRTAYAVAKSDCLLYEIQKENIQDIINHNPKILKDLSFIISDRKAKLNDTKSSNNNSKKEDYHSYGSEIFNKIKNFFHV